jgi:hypothetical protein
LKLQSNLFLFADSSTFIETPPNQKLVGVGSSFNITWKFKYRGIAPTIRILTAPKINKTILYNIKSEIGTIVLTIEQFPTDSTIIIAIYLTQIRGGQKTIRISSVTLYTMTGNCTYNLIKQENKLKQSNFERYAKSIPGFERF